MNRTRKILSLIGTAALAIASAATSAGIVVGGIAYGPGTPTETMSASFLQADGGVTTNLYTGLVEISVTGTGQSLGSCFNDAFYVFSGCGSPFSTTFYQLTADNVALVPFNPAQEIKRFIVFDVLANLEVAPGGYLPAYRADHSYRFVLDTSLLGVALGATSPLHFGVSDGAFNDNSGAYAIQVTQLSAQVPEPGSLGLCLAAGLGWLAARRKPER